jgi:hypothetical protein
MRVPRPRLTVGLAMLLIAAFAVWLGWLTHRARSQRRAVAAIKEWGGNVRYDYESTDDGRKASGKRPGPNWFARTIGIDYFHTVVEVEWIGGNWPDTNITDDELTNLDTLSGLQQLSLRFQREISGAGFEHLKGLTNLRSLDLSGTLNARSALPYLGKLT